MLLMIEVVDDPQQIFRIKIVTVGADKSKKLDLVDTLIKIVLVILDDLHANHLLGVDIVALDGFGEGRGAQVFHHLVSATNDGVDHDWEVFGFFESGLFSVEDNSQVVAIEDGLVKLSWVELIV